MTQQLRFKSDIFKDHTQICNKKKTCTNTDRSQPEYQRLNQGYFLFPAHDSFRDASYKVTMHRHTVGSQPDTAEQNIQAI